MKFILFFCIRGGLLIWPGMVALSQSPAFRATGKSLPELQQALHQPLPAPHFFFLTETSAPLPPVSPTHQSFSQIFLPEWTAECLPFFCRIEHRMGRRAPLPLKFRLGSVDYVDWLEGKRHFPATFAPN